MNAQIDKKCGEHSNMARLLKIVFNGIKEFEKYWYYKNTCKTTDKLQDLSIDFSQTLDGFLGDDLYRKILGSYKLYKHRQCLTRELRVPPTADPETKERLKQTRENIIKAWNILCGFFSWEELKEKLPADLVDRIEKL